jgi:hypothetical protein
MNKIIVIGLVIAAVIGLGAGGYYLYSRNMLGINTQPRASLVQPQTVNLADSSKKSLKDLLTAKEPAQCTYNDENGQGAAYIDSGRLRGDFSYKYQADETKGHIIIINNTSYVWTDGTGKKGIKISLDNAPQTSTGANNIDVATKVAYKCSPWTVNNSVFEFPSGIEFTDVAQLVVPEGKSPNENETMQKRCESCNNTASQEMREDCRATLGCDDPDLAQ